MNDDIREYNTRHNAADSQICTVLAEEIDRGLPKAESRLWHGNPVWFLDGNPIAGYAVRKDSVQLLFWSGQSFDEAGLRVEGKFKAAQMRYSAVEQIATVDLQRWLEKAARIQWDYKNIVKRRGRLEKLGEW